MSETAIEIAALVIGLAAFVLLAVVSLRIGVGPRAALQDDGFVPGDYHPGHDDAGLDGGDGHA